MNPKTRPLGSPASAPAFTDTDFFRRCVADRSVRWDWEGLGHMPGARDRFHKLLYRLIVSAGDPVKETGVLICIAALCERAAVDLTIPASRQTKTGRDRARPARASARSASKKGSNK
jgi:hypothetical protein